MLVLRIHKAAHILQAVGNADNVALESICYSLIKCQSEQWTLTWYTDISSWKRNADVEERARANGAVLNKLFPWAEQSCIDVSAMHGLALELHNHGPLCFNWGSVLVDWKETQ